MDWTWKKERNKREMKAHLQALQQKHNAEERLEYYSISVAYANSTMKNVMQQM